MTETPSTDPAPVLAPPPSAPARTRSLIKQAFVDELTLAEQVAATAALPEYAAALEGEEIAAAFVTDFRARIAAADALVGGAAGKSADRKVASQREQEARTALLAELQKVQTRAKRKSNDVDEPMRKKYFIGERLSNRAMIERVTRAVLATIGEDTLPGQKPAGTAALAAALDTYVQAQTDQASDQTGATNDRAALEVKVKEVADLRREIQYAADLLWPAARKPTPASAKPSACRPTRRCGDRLRSSGKITADRSPTTSPSRFHPAAPRAIATRFVARLFPAPFPSLLPMTSLSLRRLLLSSVLTSGALLAQGNSANAKGDAPNQAGSDAAWTAVTDLARTSSISKSSNGNAKTKEQVGAAIAQESARQRHAAQAAKEFYTANPGHPRAGDARKIEALSTVRGAIVADATQTQAAVKLAKDFRERTDVSVKDRFEVALAADRLALSAKIKVKTAADQSLEWQLVGERLRIEFGDLPELHDYSIEVARRTDLPSAVKLATEVAQSSKATANAKARAQSILDRAALVGRPIDLKLNKVDGGTIDLAQQKDKITVIYVWSPNDPLSLESVKRFENTLPPGAQLIYLAYGGSVPLVNRLKVSAAMAGIHCQATAGTASKAASDGLKLRYTDLPYLYVINRSGVLTGVGRMEEFTTLMAQASR